MTWKKLKKILSLLSIARYQKILPAGAKSSLFLRTYRWWNEQLTPIGKPIFILWFLFCIPATFQIGRPTFFICLIFGILNTINYMVAYFFVHLKVDVQRAHPITSFAGEPINGNILVKNNARTLLRDIEVFERELPQNTIQTTPPFISEIKRQEVLMAPYHLTINTRGIYELKSILITSSYPFGIIRKLKVKKSPQLLTIYPRLLPLELSWNKGTLASLQTNFNNHYTLEQNEYTGNREYSYGDNFNDIDHKAWARIGYPVTKVYQNDQEAKAGILFLPGYTNVFEEDAFENCLSLNASLLHDFSDKNIQVSFLCQIKQKLELYPANQKRENIYEALSQAKNEKIQLKELKDELEKFIDNLNFLLITTTTVSIPILSELFTVISNQLTTRVIICTEEKENIKIECPINIEIVTLNEKTFANEVIVLEL